MVDRPLHDALAASQRLGMLGSRPVDEVIEHAGAFVDAIAEVCGTVVDLGSGGGVPGLVIAVARPDLQMVLVDRRRTRTDHLRRLVGRLGLTQRVTVVCGEAASVQVAADAVVARGFGPPLATAVAAAPLVRDGGLLVVSEPPERESSRWDRAVDFLPVPSLDRRVAVLRRVPRETRTAEGVLDRDVSRGTDGGA